MKLNIDFRTHEGNKPSSEAFKAACNSVARFYRENGEAILTKDAFASHVTEEEKRAYVQRYCFDAADEVEKGLVTSWTVWQRINTELTGKCVALLP